jgi:YidC/Oxa1 family membrane protein insertase
MENNMEKRALLAVGLSLAVLFLWSKLFAPLPPPPPDPSAQPPGVAGTVSGGDAALGQAPGAAPGALSQAPDQAGSPGTDSPEAEGGPTPVETVAAAAEERVVLSTNVFEATFTNRGGRPLSWQLLEFQDAEGDPVELVGTRAVDMDLLPRGVWIPGREDLTRRAAEGLYQVERLPVTVGGTTYDQVRFRFADGQGLSVEKTLRVASDSYFLEVELAVREGGRPVPAWLYWGAGFGETAEGDIKKDDFYRQTGMVVVNRGGRTERFKKGKETDERGLGGEVPLLWAGMETTYFAALMIPEAPVRQAMLLPAVHSEPVAPGVEADEATQTQHLGLALAPAGDPAAPARYSVFVGPKNYELLKAHGNDLHSVINFGYNPSSLWAQLLFGWFFITVRYLAQGLYIALAWVNTYIGNYGVSIILLTILLRFVFFPLMYHSQIKMRKMQAKTKKIQPKMKAIREKYRKAKADFKGRQKMNEEIMDLYKKEGVNPMGGLAGCLPMLIQMPFLFGFFNVLRSTIELRQAPFFGWIQDLSQADPFYITPILMGVSMLVQQKMTMGGVGDPAQQRIMMFMPILFTFMFLSLPSGLVLYWFCSNLLGIGQQYLVNKQADQILVEEQQKKKKKGKDKKGKTQSARATS